MNILVTGSNGQLGSEIKDLAANYASFSFFFMDLPALDICNSSQLDVFFKENLVEAYDNLRYRGTNYDLIADKASINLFNRNIEIFMFDQSKVKVLNTN